jgi:hypothetical protein
MSLLKTSIWPGKLTENFIDMGSIQIKSESGAERQSNWLEVVRRQVGSLHYGVVQIVVHDSQVTQIEKTERVRLEKARAQTIQDDLK